MWELLKDYRISLAATLLVVMTVLWVRDWQFSTFVTRSDVRQADSALDARFASLLTMTEENTRIIEKNFNEFRLYTAVKSVEAYEDTLYQYERDVARDGITKSSAARGQDLRTRLAKAQGYKNCILEGKADCEELLKMWRER